MATGPTAPGPATGVGAARVGATAAGAGPVAGPAEAAAVTEMTAAAAVTEMTAAGVGSMEVSEIGTMTASTKLIGQTWTRLTVDSAAIPWY